MGERQCNPVKGALDFETVNTASDADLANIVALDQYF